MCRSTPEESAGPAVVIELHPRDSRAALQRLNRITGLRFARWPESLLQPPVVEGPARVLAFAAPAGRRP